MTMDELKKQEDSLRKRIALLSAAEKKAYYTMEEKRIKDPDTYAVLNYFFLAGLHHFYLGKPVWGLLNLLTMIIGLIFIQSFGLILIGIVLIVELPQLFRSQKIVQKHNNQVMQQILESLR